MFDDVKEWHLPINKKRSQKNFWHLVTILAQQRHVEHQMTNITGDFEVILIE
jgi:hypothetical protein